MKPTKLPKSRNIIQSPDGSIIVLIGRQIRLFDAGTFEEKARITGMCDAVHADISADNKYIVAKSASGLINIIEISDNEITDSARVYESKGSDIFFCKGSDIIFSGADTGYLYSHDFGSGETKDIFKATVIDRISRGMDDSSFHVHLEKDISTGVIMEYVYPFDEGRVLFDASKNRGVAMKFLEYNANRDNFAYYEDNQLFIMDKSFKKNNKLKLPYNIEGLSISEKGNYLCVIMNGLAHVYKYEDLRLCLVAESAPKSVYKVFERKLLCCSEFGSLVIDFEDDIESLPVGDYHYYDISGGFQVGNIKNGTGKSATERNVPADESTGVISGIWSGLRESNYNLEAILDVDYETLAEMFYRYGFEPLIARNQSHRRDLKILIFSASLSYGIEKQGLKGILQKDPGSVEKNRELLKYISALRTYNFLGKALKYANSKSWEVWEKLEQEYFLLDEDIFDMAMQYIKNLAVMD